MANPNTQSRPKPVVLVVLDGFGITQPYSGNAVALADTPVIKELISKYPTMTLTASGEAVGLPWGEPGNSEVGHLNLGLGRIIYQDLPRINKAISESSFYKNPALLKAVNHVKENNSKLHIMGLVSNGGIHASIEHLQALLALAKENELSQVFVHAFMDGRDTPYNSGINFIKEIERNMTEFGVGKIATLSGRFYAMDRDNHWDRIEKTYNAMVLGQGNKTDDPVKALEESYKKKIYDEEFVPTVVENNGQSIAQVGDNDAVIFYNYRSDRAREITKAFVLPGLNKFDRPNMIKNLFYVCFTEYEQNLPVEIAFPSQEIVNSLGEVISRAGLKQLRISETEKYAHVTYFFNGGRESKSEGEEHMLVPSPSVASYDMKPEMSADIVTEKLVKAVNDDIYDFIFVNFANPDMVGHSGNLPATIKAIEKVDGFLGKLVKAVLSKNGALLITADHGNAESMFNMQTGMIDKEHTSNPVPLIIVGKQYEGLNFGWQDVPNQDLSMVQPQGILSDVAPTILKIMGIDKPTEITGRSLI